MKKIYQFLYSKVGLIIIIAIYFIWSFPLTISADSLARFIGQQIGSLLSPLIIILLLSKYFEWTFNQKVLHIFLIAFVFLHLLQNSMLSGFVGFISILAFIVLVSQSIFGLFKKDKKLAEEEKKE
jgi:hypothetical protein